jgi:hypothetical protein
VIEMQTLYAHSAFWRGVSLFAGMLSGKVEQDAGAELPVPRDRNLVSWRPGARSRREDELARTCQEEIQ